MGTRACDVLQRACVDLSKCTHPLSLPVPPFPTHDTTVNCTMMAECSGRGSTKRVAERGGRPLWDGVGGRREKPCGRGLF